MNVQTIKSYKKKRQAFFLFLDPAGPIYNPAGQDIH